MLRIGSLFSGAGGLDMAVEAVFDARVVWQSEIDPAASKVLAHHWPEVPNLGDITLIGWDNVEPVDILCGGFPCQDVSAAGKRAGIADGTRSGLWSIFADAIEALRPPIVIIENVRGLLNARAHRNMESDPTDMGNGSGRPILRAAGAVLGDLADLRYDAQWVTYAAGDVGAPHKRERVFIVATDTERRGGTRVEDAAGDSETDSQGRQTVLARGLGHPGGKRPDGIELVQTPQARDGKGLPGSGFNAGNLHSQVIKLLPTPCAQEVGTNPDRYDEWCAELKAKGYNGNGHGRSLSVEAQRIGRGDLLPTPCVVDRLATTDMTLEQWDESKRSQKERGVGSFGPRGDSLGAAVLRADAGTVDDRPDYSSSRAPQNKTAPLLPTPNASDGSGGGQHPDKREGHSRQLIDYVLLCTPSASDGAGGKTSRSGSRISEPLLGGQAREMATAWGKYAPAIARWEALTRPAPAPTEPNKNGNPRLAAAFSEWMMGWPAGHVTDPAIGLSRNDQLRIVGNGVCPQQAQAAIRLLIGVATETHHTDNVSGTLLPTPRATDGTKGGPNQRGSSGDLMLPSAVMVTEKRDPLLPTPTSRDHKGANQRGDDTCLHGEILKNASGAAE